MNMRSDKQMMAKAGFTLAEIMVAAGLSLFIFAILISASVNYQKLFKTQQLTNEMQQNVRAAIEMVSRDLRTCGYGLQVSSGTLSQWITTIAGFDTNPKILAGASGTSDTMHLAAAFGQPIGYLAADASQGDTTLTLTADPTNVTVGSVLFVGGLQTARVTSDSGNMLGISTSPSTLVGLEFDIEAGAPVEVVSTITYNWINNPSQFPYKPYLQRIDSTRIYNYDWQKMAAGNIESFNVAVTGKVVDISITGRTGKPEYGYTHPIVGDHYRRFTVSTKVVKRN
ncbi:MAG: PilW family protein [Kiritimatiellia bacterium]